MPDDRLQPVENFPLAPLTTLGVGGNARWYVRAGTTDAIARAVEWARLQRAPLFVMGGGSNLVIADEGWPGLVLHVAVNGLRFDDVGGHTRISAGAGESWDAMVAACVERGLAGVECLSGIPGTVGGTPVQNVGAYGQDVSASIVEVEVLDRTDGALRLLTADECDFAYRMSRFKREPERFIVCHVTFHLRRGGPTLTYPDVITHLREHAIMSPGIADVRNAVLAIRRRKGMVLDPSDSDTRSVGSFFVNPIVPARVYRELESRFNDVPSFPAGSESRKIPAAWLIQRAGIIRGQRLGGAAVSGKHPLALVNRDAATARDVVALAVTIKRAVADRFGIWLKPEPVFVGFDGDADVTYLQDAHS